MKKTLVNAALVAVAVALAITSAAYAATDPRCAGKADGEKPAGESEATFVCMAGGLACNEGNMLVGAMGGCRAYMKWLQYPDWETFPVYNTPAEPAQQQPAPAQQQPAPAQQQPAPEQQQPAVDDSAERSVYQACSLAGEDLGNGLRCTGVYYCCYNNCDWWNHTPLCGDVPAAASEPTPAVASVEPLEYYYYSSEFGGYTFRRCTLGQTMKLFTYDFECTEYDPALDNSEVKRQSDETVWQWLGRQANVPGEVKKNVEESQLPFGLIIVVIGIGVVIAVFVFIAGKAGMSYSGPTTPIGPIFSFAILIGAVFLAGIFVAQISWQDGNTDWAKKGALIAVASIAAAAIVLIFGVVTTSYYKGASKISVIDVPVLIITIGLATKVLFGAIIAILLA